MSSAGELREWGDTLIDDVDQGFLYRRENVEYFQIIPFLSPPCHASYLGQTKAVSSTKDEGKSKETGTQQDSETTSPDGPEEEQEAQDAEPVKK